MAKFKFMKEHREESERLLRDPGTQDVEFSQNADSLLSSLIVEHPALAETLNLTHYHYKALRAALNSGNLCSKATFEHVKGLFNVYFKHEAPKSRTVVTEFAVDLGVPKLSYDMIIDRRNNHQELTTWDRVDGFVENRSATVASAENLQDHSDDKQEREALKMSQYVISQLLAAVLNFSDLSDKFSLACDEAGLVPLLVDMTKELQDSIPHNVKYVNDETQQLSKYTARGKMLSRALGILHNLSKRVPARRSFASCEAVNVLIPLLKAEVVLYSTKSLLILAYLIDEENNHLIMADKGPIKFLTGLLKKALTTHIHRYLGFTAAEIAEGLTQIAVNDSNKKTIGQSGAVPILVSMLQNAQDDDEKLKACRTLWTLAFDDENKKEIKENKFAMAELEDLLSSENRGLRRAAAGALWECQGKKKHAEEKQLSVTAHEASADTKHVMISYQWDVQQSMIQLRNQLQENGYKVWMDIDEMGGSTLESMASAVENASVVLVGVSQKYKESPNCRSEAEYTYQLHKDIIPLMMEYKYKPDGWLGIIVGAKLWIDFSERHKLDTNIDKLTKELGNRGKIAAQETVQAATVDLVDASPQTSIRSWKNGDVLNWLKEAGLQDRADSKAVQRLDGRMLLRLQDLRKESPEFFYTSIRTDLKLANVFDVVEFTDELDKLA